MPLTNKSAISVKAFNIQQMTTSVHNTISGPPRTFQLIHIHWDVFTTNLTW